jgi:hypothetical protein
MVAIGAAIMLLSASFPAAAQDLDEAATRRAQQSAPAGPVPHRPDGKPDFSGFWNTNAQITNMLEEHPAGYAIRAYPSVIVDTPDKKLPYQAWALKERNWRRQAEQSHFDPEGHCFLSGTPRQMYVMPYQFIQTADYVTILYEYIHAVRLIPLTLKTHVPDKIRLWEGSSLGHWEGDTLVIETTNNNGKLWLELSGDFLSDAAVVTERFTMKDSNTINYRATINDPKVYTRQWTMEFQITRLTAKDMEILESACHEDNRDKERLANVGNVKK